MDHATAEAALLFAEEASAGATGPQAKVALEGFEGRLDELLAAIDWFISAEQPNEARRVANALYRFWITKQRFAEGAAIFDRVRAAPGGDDLLRGKAALYGGMMPFWMGDDARATELFDEALETARRLDDLQLTSQALGGLARVALRSDVPEARRLAAEALAVSDAADDEAGRSNALHLLGVGAQVAGDLLEAREWMTQRLALVRASDNQFLIASEAANLSMVERQLGDLDAAEALDREALEIEARTGDRFTTPFAISGLASIATERGQFDRAATLVGAAEAIMETQGMAWPPDERPHYERLLTALPAAIGSEAFGTAQAAGRAMTASDAVAFALERAQ